MTAEVFLAALESFHGYQPEKGTPLAWLMGIAHHKLMDYYRRSSRSISLEQIEGHPDGMPDPEETAARHIQVDQITAAIADLPPARAEALALFFYARLSLAEVSVVIGKSQAAVEKLIYRGLADLRQRFVLEPEEVE